MVRSRIAFCLATLLALASAASAGIHSFPSASSTVVGSVGFIDVDEVGYFWSVGRGDLVEETVADPLATVSQMQLYLDVPFNNLSAGQQVDWDVLLNGATVGSFSVPNGFTGSLSPFYAFAPIANVAGNYTVRLAVTNEVPSGFGSHTFAYDGDFQHAVELVGAAVPEPGTLAMLGFGVLAAYRRRRGA